MSQTSTYRLGNQPEEYELSEEYLGWTPESLGSWEMFHYEYTFGKKLPKSITLVNSDGKTETLNLHQRLNKDAFPLNFFGEARATGWCNFLMVSEMETPEKKFIIPMH